MDKKWIEQTIKNKRKSIMLSIIEHVQGWDYGEAAAIIAQAHEQDKADAMHTQFLMDRKAIIEAQVQVAGLAEALRKIIDMARLMAASNFALDVMCVADLALKDTPQVLWSGKAGIKDVELGGPFVEHSKRRFVLIPMEGDPLAGHGMTVAETIVLQSECLVEEGCSRHHEQGQESEQEKG